MREARTSSSIRKIPVPVISEIPTLEGNWFRAAEAVKKSPRGLFPEKRIQLRMSLGPPGKHLCDKDRSGEAIQEMECYCRSHPRGPAAVRRPTLMFRGNNYVVLLGKSISDGIVGNGTTVSMALRAFDLQYLKAIRPPNE